MDKKELENRVIEAIKTCYDPEIPVDVYELGLIYDVSLKDIEGSELSFVDVLMTLTSPNCPVAESLPMEVENKVRHLTEVEDAKVEITFEPPWTKDMMSEEAQYELGFM
jgi:FeS assembly SUF system protein|tara:strand:+ start:364 stop:690 length:327 start_codon:yes stop_codon:yes gene_type:complete